MLMVTLIITNVLTFVALMFAVVPAVSKRYKNKQLLADNDNSNKFEKAQKAIENIISDNTEAHLREETKTYIHNKTKSGETLDLSVVLNLDGTAESTSILEGKTEFVLHKGGAAPLDDFSPDEKSKLIETFLDAWSKRFDDYADSQLAVDGAIKRFVTRYKAKTEARAEIETLESNTSWEKAYQEVENA